MWLQPCMITIGIRMAVEDIINIMDSIMIVGAEAGEDIEGLVRDEVIGMDIK